MKVPLVDLARINNQYLTTWHVEFEKIVRTSQLHNGYWNQEFEKRFAEFVGTNYCVGVSSGLDALVLMLKASFPSNVKVAVPANTAAPTIEAIFHADMQPVIMDVDNKGLLQWHDDVADYALPVYLYGKSFHFNKAKHFVDACQAHGSFKNQESCFSFYPSKNLGCLGDGGAICTNNSYIYQKCKELREHGQPQKNVHTDIGYTARLDNLQAMFLYYKLNDLKSQNNERIELAYNYYKAFQEIGLETQCDNNDFDESHVFHLFVVLTEKRSELIKFLDEKQIGYGFHYPYVLSDLPCYDKYSLPINYKNSRIYAEQGLSLPIFPGMTSEEQSYVIESVKECLG